MGSSAGRASGALLVLAACSAGGDDTGEQDTGASPEAVLAALVAPGPWKVGYQETSLPYADPVDGTERTLRLALWYPTPDTTGESVAVGLYQSDAAWRDATVADGAFPLAVFSHGHQGYAENSSFLLEHLASHGWVVAAPDHTGNTTFDDADRDTSIYLQRPGDVSAVLDAAPGLLPTDGGPALLVGHSFGGYTTFPLAGAPYDVDGILAACAAGTGGNICDDLDPSDEALLRAGLADDRFGAAVAMAPGDSALFGDGLAAMAVPMLHMTATEDQGEGSEADDIWARLTGGDHRRVVLVGGGHQSFTDYSDVLEDVPLAQDESFRIVDAFVLAWGRSLLGDASVAPLLDGEASVSDLAELYR